MIAHAMTSKKTPRPYDVSVVIPVYFAERTIGKLGQELLEVFTPSHRVQIILVNDGSTDGTHSACESLAADYPQSVTYLRLARNFGEHNAVMAGLREAQGEYVVIMDDDFQHRPSDALRLYREARRNDYDIVYSRYGEVHQTVLRRWGSRFNGWIATRLLGKPKDLYLSSFKCLSRWLTGEVIKYRGPFPYLDGLAFRCTRNFGTVDVEHQAREKGRSGYNLRRLVRLWLNMFVNFSITPLRLSSLLGFLFVVFAAVLSGWVVVDTLTGRSIPEGWPFLAIVIMLFSGAQLMILGVVGEYVGRILLSLNETPQYVVRQAWRSGSVVPDSQEGWVDDAAREVR